MILLTHRAEFTMTDHSHIPPTGAEKMVELVARERIVREARYLALRATLGHNAPVPMPPQDRATAKDLRRGRMHPLGRVLWFLRILKERQHPNARELAERLRDLVSEAIDLELPKVAVEPEKVRVWRQPLATKPLRVVRPRGDAAVGRSA